MSAGNPGRKVYVYSSLIDFDSPVKHHAGKGPENPLNCANPHCLEGTLNIFGANLSPPRANWANLASERKLPSKGKIAFENRFSFPSTVFPP